MTVQTSLDDRRATGVAARERTPRSAHSGWEPATDQPSPVKVLEEESAGRERDYADFAAAVRSGQLPATEGL
jgi:hypothetical protein